MFVIPVISVENERVSKLKEYTKGLFIETKRDLTNFDSARYRERDFEFKLAYKHLRRKKTNDIHLM